MRTKNFMKDLSLTHELSNSDRPYTPIWLYQQQHRQEDIKTKGDCCFNHIIGLPKKDGHRKPLFDYEMQVIRGETTTRQLQTVSCSGFT
jgi:hypothetical protein